MHKEKRLDGKSATNLAAFSPRFPKARPGSATATCFAALQALAEDLDKLLFARDLLRQALVYGRYHAKAREAKTQ